jgi:hypothetical protein
MSWKGRIRMRVPSTWLLCGSLLSACAGARDPDVPTAIEQGLCKISDDPEQCCHGSPIILDLAGNGIALTDVAGGVAFKLNPHLGPEQISWTAAGTDDAWLALDRNGNGYIDDGSELFGNFTPQPQSAAPQGYLALAVYDQNHDGVIDAEDPVFRNLRLWQDRNHNGVSEQDELSTLTDHGILGLGLSYIPHRQVDANGNLFRYRAGVRVAPGSTVGPLSYDVFVITRSLAAEARAQGAVQENGSVSMLLVAPSCGGGGNPYADCQLELPLPPPPHICNGNAPVCVDCQFLTVGGNIPVCVTSCTGGSGFNEGVPGRQKCYICPAEGLCSPGEDLNCNSRIS